ncbi:hypothetical protein [Thalassotalea atypica]|uniref:hypothetical protein n=1 Tax=Thalassotalea atypica TaxID=2054316 RepID=UPI0025745792|nr:hypothetical protein [Thalassotalea atypica]
MQRVQRLKLDAISLIAVFISAVAILSVIAQNQIKQTTLGQISATLLTLLLTVRCSTNIWVNSA